MSAGAEHGGGTCGPAGAAEAVGKSRAFYAFWPEPDVAAALASLGAALGLEPSAQLQTVDQLHMTLAFVGDVDSHRLEELREIGRSQQAGSMLLKFDAYEYWPKPEVVVAAARDVPLPLVQLWGTLHRDLSARGFALTPKRLRPHVTLARKVAQAPVLPPLLPAAWRAFSFSLVASARDGVRSRYTVLDSWSLLDK